jgi:hypothetical protein
MSSTTLFEYSGVVAVLVIGLVTCIAVSSRLRGATLPLAGLFVLAADSKLFWAQLCVLGLIEQLGYVKALRDHPWVGTWYYGWHVLPVLLAGFFAWQLWKGLRRMMPAANEPPSGVG